MGRGGLVAYVESEIERSIALGQLHPSGQFASEVELARRMKVCRGTMREALRRLAARGLVVQRPGRKTRAVALDESLTLENLGLALHDARSPEARWLLEGSFSLRRQVLVELLVDCCAKASERDLNQLSQLCFGLWDAARWESGERCAQVEFELLRLAARVAERPGHVLLVQSLQRAFLGGAARLLPFMGGEALREWAIRAMHALSERDTRALQQELPALMQACDERVLNAFAPVVLEPDSLDASRVPGGSIEAPVPVPDSGAAVEPCSLIATPEPGRLAAEHDSAHFAPTQVHGGALDSGPTLESSGSEGPVSAAVDVDEGEGSTGPDEGLTSEPSSGTLLPPSTPGEARCAPCDSCPEGAVVDGLADGPTGGRTSSPMGGFQHGTPLAGTIGQGHGGARMAGGLLHGALGRLGQWAARLWRSMAMSAGRPPS